MPDATLTGLFLSAFLGATLLPLSSEAVLGGIALAGGHSLASLWLVATVGNVGGAVVNWGLGYWLVGRSLPGWLDEPALVRAGERYRRWGVWSLLLAWLPVVGDPLTVAAGLFRTPLPLFVLLVLLGKGGRYGLVLYALS